LFLLEHPVSVLSVSGAVCLLQFETKVWHCYYIGYWAWQWLIPFLVWSRQPFLATQHHLHGIIDPYFSDCVALLVAE